MDAKVKYPILTVPQVADLVYLAYHMRPDEIDQFEGLTARTYDPEIAARTFLQLNGPAWVLLDVDGTPACAGGFEPVAVGMYRSWMAGTTEGWAKHWRTLTKYGRRQMDALLAADARRIEDFALASRTEAHEWYRRGLGMAYEGTHKAWFADGRDAVCYAKVEA